MSAYQWDDEDRMFKVRDLIATSPENQFHLFLENPLEYGYDLCSITDDGMLVIWFSCVTAYDFLSLTDYTRNVTHVLHRISLCTDLLISS